MKQPGVRVESPTEQVNPRTAEIDTASTLQMVRLINDEDRLVADAVAQVLPSLAELVDAAADRLEAGGRVHYFGAGTSGRLGILDAAELVPTFGVPPDLVVAHQAGGPAAFVGAAEDAEDDEQGIDAVGLTGQDVAIGLAASGRTPYVGAALTAARRVGAVTALVTANPDAPLAPLADHLLVVLTGEEAITGSTRLKAGSAQKMVLNTFSTALMIKLGHAYGNFMVDMLATNAKLRGRSIGLLMQATGADEDECSSALRECGTVKVALVYLLARRSGLDVDVARCRQALDAARGRARDALARLARPS